MSDELILVYRTRKEAFVARRELVDEGVPEDHLALSGSRALGQLVPVTEGRTGAVLGALAGGLAGGTAALVAALTAGASGAGVKVAIVTGMIGACVGAFIGGVAGLEFDQPEGLERIGSFCDRGYALAAAPRDRAEERTLRRVARHTHAALVTRAPVT